MAVAPGCASPELLLAVVLGLSLLANVPWSTSPEVEEGEEEGEVVLRYFRPHVVPLWARSVENVTQ